jgi:Tol biopolymer transport system component
MEGKMKIKIAKGLFLAMNIGILFCFLSCTSDDDKDNTPTTPTLPASLPETIPYENIVQGKLVFERLGPPTNNYNGVYVIDANARKSWGIDYGAAEAPQVSPDGTQIAFSKYFDSQTIFDIHVMRIDGTQPQNISSLAGQDRQPSWTPDGNQVLFWIISGNELLLYRQTPTANPQDRVVVKTSYPDVDGPFSVSPGLKVVFINRIDEPKWEITTMNLDGSTPVLVSPLAPEGIYYHSPVWSPDGTKIAYLKTEEDTTLGITKSLELFIMDPDGRHARSVIKFDGMNAEGTWSGHNDVSVCWSPDGSKLAFNKKVGHLSAHIFLINPDGTGLTQVTSQLGVTDRSLSWSR